MWSKPSPSNSLHNGSRQSQHPQEPGGTALAAPASSCPLPLHPDTCLLGQLGGMFFSILGKQGLSQSVHTSKRQLKEFLLDYIARNNENPSPFVWNKGPERLQHIIEARKEYQATHARKLRKRRRTPHTIEKLCTREFFPERTAERIQDGRFRFCHIDVDVYQLSKDICERLWPRLVSGGLVAFDDYGMRVTEGLQRFVNEWRVATT
jgi:hypothetical protein